jgi:hypothetical protein
MYGHSVDLPSQCLATLQQCSTASWRLLCVVMLGGLQWGDIVSKHAEVLTIAALDQFAFQVRFALLTRVRARVALDKVVHCRLHLLDMVFKSLSKLRGEQSRTETGRDLRITHHDRSTTNGRPAAEISWRTI